MSVYDQMGKPIVGAQVSVNDTLFATDSMGQVSFEVPRTATMAIGVQSEGGKLESASEYSLTPGGFLVCERQAEEAVDRIEESIVVNERAPQIAYAPTVVETSQPFVLIGKNLSGKADGDHILLDGYDADVFSGSTVSLLATTPRRLSLGALREMYVTTGDETSNTVEVDVCKVEVSMQKTESGQFARIRAIGTNVPSLVEFRNMDPDKTSFSFGQRKLGKRSALITCGGENNCVDLTISAEAGATPDVDTHLIADAPWSPDDRTTFGDESKRKIVVELNKAEIIRLKRRLIAIEQRISEDQTKRTTSLNAGSLSAAELDKLNAQLRTLSNRQRRINAMVVSRRAVFQALGGTEESYRQALDDAAGGGAIAMEKCLAPLTSASLLASTSAMAVANTVNVRSIEDALNVDRNKEMQQLAELTRMWKKFPTKVGHSSRLAPPPPPVVPDLTALNGENYDYARYMRYGAPPPPPPLVQMMKRSNRSKHATAASLSKRHVRPKSKSPRR
jgi:hypothetical protein